MKTTKVLLIESARNSSESFAEPLSRKYQVQIAHSGKQGVEMAQDEMPAAIVLDAVSLRTSGNRISFSLRAALEQTPIVHIRAAEATGNSAADVLLVPPFTARKLTNRIDRLTVPAEGALLQVGPFSLNAQNQMLTTPWTEKKLTPKLVELMELFMVNLNNTLERRYIMQQVWKTDYMGDTRTLDVHIRWLRKAVEPNPRKPQYITTVRGVGYRFTVQGGADEAEKAI
ncbi:MAG: response regulator transcription factor [Anaerolineae bacterium]|nr:response regulator transcription factor [Anaerolineae bacterium]MEB2286734.1 response regulator transcription factor [Anaerolineae bacterium]